MIGDVRYLIVFAKVVEKGSFTAAAKELKMSTASTSLYVSRLEESLGVALLYRNTRKLSLTFDGEKVYTAASSILNLYEHEVLQLGKGPKENAIRKFKIAIPAILIKSQLLKEISSYFANFPEIRVALACNDCYNDIVGEAIDLAIRLGNMPDSSLKAKKLFSVDRRVVASPEFLARNPLIAHPKDLEAMNWIGLSMRPSYRRFTHVSGEQCEISYTSNFMADNVEASYQLACHGVGLAAPPTFLIDERDGVELVLPEWELEPLPAHAVWPANVAAGSVTYGLIEHLEAALKSQVPIVTSSKKAVPSKPELNTKNLVYL